MMVLAIIGLLAAIAMPALNKPRISTNDTLAVKTLRTLSNSLEMFKNDTGDYPFDYTFLTTSTPPYLGQDICDQIIAGFNFFCSLSASNYILTAIPVSYGETGSRSFTMTTGGVLEP